LSLKINPKTSRIEFSLLHELGHYIDHQGFNPYREASKSDEMLDEWRKVLEKSDSVKQLRKAVSRKSDFADFARYLLRPSELWARSHTNKE
jgi:predicted SprT family Zn-dependent metalloprotease